MYIQIEENEAKQLLEFIKKHEEGHQFVNVIQTALEMNEDTIGETYVRWVIDDITNEYEMRYGKPPKKGWAESFMSSYVSLGDLDDIGGDEAIAAGWNVIYSAFKDYEKDRRQKNKG